MKPSIENKLAGLVERHEEIGMMLTEQSTIQNQNKFRELSKEYADLEPLVATFKRYQSILDQQVSAKALLAEDDAEMREMAEEELKDVAVQIEVIEKELQLFLIPKDPDDDKNVFLEIRGGAGGDEAVEQLAGGIGLGDVDLHVVLAAAQLCLGVDHVEAIPVNGPQGVRNDLPQRALDAAEWDAPTEGIAVGHPIGPHAVLHLAEVGGIGPEVEVDRADVQHAVGVVGEPGEDGVRTRRCMQMVIRQVAAVARRTGR